MSAERSSSLDSNVLNQIREGMDVYDIDRNRIGSVDAVFFGAAGDEEVAEGTAPATAPPPRDAADGGILEPFAEALDPRDEVPEEVAERLRYHGYIRIDRGWFGADRYVMPEQIESVSDEGVFLGVHKDNLFTE